MQCVVRMGGWVSCVASQWEILMCVSLMLVQTCAGVQGYPPLLCPPGKSGLDRLEDFISRLAMLIS